MRTFALALAALLATGTAHADEEQWTNGIASLPILSATPYVNVSVRNLSASTDPADRALTMTSAMPEVVVDAQVFCSSPLGGARVLDSAQLVFGNAFIDVAPAGYEVWEFTWDASEIQEFGNVDAADLWFEHTLDMPTTWDDPLIEWGFNPVGVVEKHLDTYVDNGGSPADFLRDDAVYEATIDLNLVAWCTNTSQYGVISYPGITTRPITVAVFYHGDPDIQDPITVVPTPGSITQDEPDELDITTGTGTSDGRDEKTDGTRDGYTRTTSR